MAFISVVLNTIELRTTELVMEAFNKVSFTVLELLTTEPLIGAKACDAPFSNPPKNL